MNDLLTNAEAAAILRVDKETVRRWAREGRLQGKRVGRDWRFRREDVEALVNEPAKKAA